MFDLSVLNAAGAVSFTGHYDLVLAAVPGGTRLRLGLRITETTVEAVPYIAGIVDTALGRTSGLGCGRRNRADPERGTFRFDERTVRASRDPIGRREIDGVWRGLVFVRDEPDVSTAALVDRSANVITERLPGELEAISDRYAIFRTSEDGDIAVEQ